MTTATLSGRTSQDFAVDVCKRIGIDTSKVPVTCVSFSPIFAAHNEPLLITITVMCTVDMSDVELPDNVNVVISHIDGDTDDDSSS